MASNKTTTAMRLLKLHSVSLIVAALISSTITAQAQNDYQGAVSALGRLQPRDGIIRVGALLPSEGMSELV